MNKKRNFFILGALTGLIMVYPYCGMDVMIPPSDTIFWLNEIFSSLPQSMAFGYLLKDFLLYILLACVFCNFTMGDIEINRIYVFPRSASRCRWFIKKTGRLFLNYICFWLAFLFLSVAPFLLSNRLPLTADLFTRCGVYLFTNSLLAYFLFILLINLLTLLWDKWIALFSGLVLYMVQFFIVALALQGGGKAPYWLRLLPYLYPKYALFQGGAVVDALPYPFILLAEFFLLGLLIFIGFVIARKKLCRLGESL